MNKIEYDVACPYCGQVFRVSSLPSTQVECECPHCQQTVIFDAPETGENVLTNEDFETEPSYAVSREPVQQEYMSQPAPVLQEYNAQPQYYSGMPQKKSHLPLIIGLLALLLVLGGVGYWYYCIYCPEQQELTDYNFAKTKGDVYAARDFLHKHEKDATSEHRLAMQNIVTSFVNDSTAWEKTKSIVAADNLNRSILALESYLTSHPKGMHRNDASAQLTKLRGEAAEQARIEEEARNKMVNIEMVTNGDVMRSYYCNYGSHEETLDDGTIRYYLESNYIQVPSGKTWRVTNWDWHYGLNKMYYPQIVLDNGYSINVNVAVGEGYCIPGGHSFKIRTPSMYSYDDSFYSYSLTVYFYEADS